MMTPILYVLCFIGIITFPIFTCGIILLHYGHNALGLFAVAWSIWIGHLKAEKREKDAQKRTN